MPLSNRMQLIKELKLTETDPVDMELLEYLLEPILTRNDNFNNDETIMEPSIIDIAKKYDLANPYYDIVYCIDQSTLTFDNLSLIKATCSENLYKGKTFFFMYDVIWRNYITNVHQTAFNSMRNIFWNIDFPTELNNICDYIIQNTTQQQASKFDIYFECIFYSILSILTNIDGVKEKEKEYINKVYLRDSIFKIDRSYKIDDEYKEYINVLVADTIHLYNAQQYNATHPPFFGGRRKTKRKDRKISKKKLLKTSKIRKKPY